MNKINTPLADNTLITREATLADDEALRELIAVPMTTKAYKSAFSVNQVILRRPTSSIGINCMS